MKSQTRTDAAPRPSRRLPVRGLPVVFAAALITAGILFAAAAQAADAQQIETRKIGILLNHNSKTITDLATKTYELAVSDFNKRLMDENRGWQPEAEVVVVQGPDGAVAELERFSNAGIAAVAGIVPDNSLVAADNVIHDNDMVVVAYFTGLKENAKPDNVYRVGTNYEHLSEAFVEIMNEDGKNEVITLFLNSPVSRGINSSVYDLAGARNDMTVLGSIKFTPGAISDAEKDSIKSDMTSLLAGARDTSEIGIVFSGISSSLPVFQALAELDTGPGSPIRDVTIYGVDSFRPTIETDADTFEFLQRTGGFYGISSGEHENEESIRIDSILGRSITVVTYDSYTSLYILGLAIDMAGTATDADAIKDKMHEAAAKYSPIAARGLPTDLDENGDVVERDLHISSIQHGQFEFTRKYDPDSIHRINEIIDFQEPERRTVGAIVSETGSLSEWLGRSSSEAISLAVADYNKEQLAKATIDDPGWRIELTKRDDGTDPSKAREHTDRFSKTRGLHLIIGPVSSGAVEAIRDYSNIPILSYASASPQLSIPNDNIFRMPPDDTGAVQQYARILREDGIRNAIIIYRDDPWGNGLDAALKDAIGQARGVTLLGSIDYPTSETDYTAITDRLAAALGGVTDRANTAVMLFGFDEVVDITQAASENPQLQQGKWYGYGNLPALLDDAGRAAWLEKVGYTIVSVAHAPNDISRHIDSEVEGANVYSYYAYDAVMLAADLMDRIAAHAHTPLTVAQLAEGIEQGRQGPNALGVPLVFNDNGDLDPDYVYYSIETVSGGAFVIDSVSPPSKPARACR